MVACVGKNRQCKAATMLVFPVCFRIFGCFALTPEGKNRAQTHVNIIPYRKKKVKRRKTRIFAFSSCCCLHFVTKLLQLFFHRQKNPKKFQESVLKFKNFFKEKFKKPLDLKGFLSFFQSFLLSRSILNFPNFRFFPTLDFPFAFVHFKQNSKSFFYVLTNRTKSFIFSKNQKKRTFIF